MHVETIMAPRYTLHYCARLVMSAVCAPFEILTRSVHRVQVRNCPRWMTLNVKAGQTCTVLDVLDCFIVNYAPPQVTGVKLL